MYRNKKDVDKHVENLISKLSAKEFKTRAYSIARLYYEVGDYNNCQKYVEQYLTQKDNNAAAYKLLGQALQKLGQKEKALEQYKTSLDIDPTQTSTILDICELLADDEVVIDPGRAKYWCEKAEATFPRHPVTFQLRERIVSLSNPDPEALVNLLKAELAVRPKDSQLHARLLKHYLHNNQIKEAFDHSCNVEFDGNSFLNNYVWYETLAELLKHSNHNTNDWLYQLLLLTVRERICVLSLTETPIGTSKSLIESNELLHAYDQAIESVAKSGPPTGSSGSAEFHASLLQHHRGQFAFHAATFLLKKAKRDQLSWRDATKTAAPLMLIAWHTVPLDLKVNWLTHAPEKQRVAVQRWYLEGTYRCSQSGHYIQANIQDKSQYFLDQISQCCSSSNWRLKLYEKLFTSRSQLAKTKTSHMVSNAFTAPVLRLPRKVEVEAYDNDAQRHFANSLHHFVWILLNYKNYAHFKCTLFDMLTPTMTNCGPETLNKLDIHAFLYSAALTSRQHKFNETPYGSADKPNVLPANITDLLCSLAQMKWWDCAYKFSQNALGSELTDIRATLSRGIEVVRCVDNHGMDPELLCLLGRIFSERAKLTTAVDEKNNLEIRAGLYYASAIPVLEKLKNKIIVKMPEKRLFDYSYKELDTKELNALIEESKLYVAVNHLNDCEYDKVIDLLFNLKSPQAYYHLSQAYKKIAMEENNISATSDTKSKCAALLLKAKTYAYKALDILKDTKMNKNNTLYSDTQELIEDVETQLAKIDPDLSGTIVNDVDGKYSSDENISLAGPRITNSIFRNLSSTPKQAPNPNATNYRTAVDSHILENTHVDQQFLERIETEIKNLQKRDTTINDFMEQTKMWFEENRKLGNQIISTINSNIQNTTDQFKLLKISVDHVKDQIDECRNECKDVGDLKKQIAELKKEVNKLKKASSEQTIDESDLYNVDDDYRTTDSTSSFAAQLPFTPSQVLPAFNQRIVPPFPVPPNPYQLYGQNLYNLYNQYSQFAQTPTVPGAPSLFDPARSQVNYPGVYPTPDQMYLDVAHLIPPAAPGAPTVPSVPTVPIVPPLATAPTVPVPTIPPVSAPPVSSIGISKSLSEKEMSRSLPANVVITSSDPLPTCTSAPAPILSVTIPPKHIKTPHNYQIPMPSVTETKVIAPPVFSFPASGNKTVVTSANPVVTWNQSPVLNTTKPTAITTPNMSNNILGTPKIGETLDQSKSVVDGIFSGASPNTSINKSRTISERSNTSVENYDPCPDFKPIIPLPAEVKVTTGEEDEEVIFSSRAKLFRFIDKQWKERGLGEMKLLKHKVTGKVRVLMRREQIHKICANHLITSEMEIKPMKNETKAYFWVANDFADETVVLEKFCIRFKTADIAKDFYNTFEKARQESSANTSITDTPKSENNSKIDTPNSFAGQFSTPLKSNTVTDSQPGKTVLGGFTFSSTPTFRPVSDDTTTKAQIAEPTTNKVNVFSGLSFKTNSNSPFSNLIKTTSTPEANVSSTNQTPGSTNKLNTSDTVEEFEPNVEFKPVIPLPALVDQKTGEEDEDILFEHRAKLLRFDASSKEWKERGLGNIKLLVHKDNIQKVRLLMRREQIMKVCCNHTVTKDMMFQKMPNMDKAVTWCAKDFSEGELVAETFCLRFKTVQSCDDFIAAVKSAQSKIKDESKAAKEEQNAAKQNNQTGFGDKFKPKVGSWHCDSCYTNNLENYNKCVCCDQPKPSVNEAGNATSNNNTPKLTFGISGQSLNKKDTPTSTTTVTSGWGDKFKPKEGSWECKECFVRNDSNTEKCSACNNPKDPNAVKKETSSIFNTPTTGPKFSFGIPAQSTMNSQTQKAAPAVTTSAWGDKFKPKEGTWECKECLVRNESNADKCSACNNPKDPNAKKETNSVFSALSTGPKFSFGVPAQTAMSIQTQKETSTTTTAVTSGWGDKFKPKEGSWECKECLVRNESNTEKCSACNAPKDPNAVKKETSSVFGGASTGPKFSFGIPASVSDNQKPQSITTSIFDGKGGHKFSFGTPSETSDKNVIVVSFGDQKPAVSNTLKAPENEGPVNFSLKKNEDGQTVTVVRPALLPTPQAETPKTTFGNKEGGTFDFVFKPKTPSKGKSPIKSPKSQGGDDSDGNEYASEDEGHHIHFSPVIPMPDKVEVVTGEENEDELYGHRAKLFRFTNSEWKERGIGIVKILKHKNTGKLRVLMRREQVLKICLNHALTSDITYSPKDEKSWYFTANDFSEGTLSLEQFCLRFKTKEIAMEFKEAIDKARNQFTTPVQRDNKTETKDNDSEDVVFVSETLATTEEKQRAKELMLPENFFTYKNKEPCQGCRGCNDGDDSKTHSTEKGTTTVSATVTATVASTPIKIKTPVFQSPTSSIYGTPTNFDRTSDTSMFRTPLGLIESNTTSGSANVTNNTLTESDGTNKENTFVEKLSETPTAADSQTPVSRKGFSLAAPKLSTLNTSDSENTDAKTIFGQKVAEVGGNKSIFGSGVGTSMKTAIFGFSSSGTKDENKKPEVKSIFGSEDQKPVNLFSGTSTGSLFGPGALSNSDSKSSTSIFGSPVAFKPPANQTSIFGGTKSIFGNASNQATPWSIPSNVETKKPEITSSVFGNKKIEDVETDSEPKKDAPFSVGNTVSFADLTSGGPGFNIQKKPDFKWEGAGQQLFTAPQPGDKSKNESVEEEAGASAGAEEEYDPHYEPIVPLPDKITVTTGEEDEEKLFGERCKLYRYDDKTREWKERGVGEMKILYHPERKTYRLLLRREQVHKAVLNMLIFMDLELLPMKNSDRAWTWAGRNYAETVAGEQETLAVRFKSIDLATGFHDKVIECVRKLQAAAAQVIREEKESSEKAFGNVAPLRLPKHLADSARADAAMSANAHQAQSESAQLHKTEPKPNGEVNKAAETKQVHFQEEEQVEDEEEYEHDYDNEDYDAYYNEDEDESGAFYTYDAEALVKQGNSQSSCEHARIQVMFDQEIYSPRILVTDADTGEILADMLIYTDTEFQMDGESCTLSGTDYSSNDPVDKTVTLKFQDTDTAVRFYDGCEKSKYASYSYGEVDPDS